MDRPETRARCEQAARALRPLLSDYVHLHARRNPQGLALIEHDTGQRVTWRQFATSVDAFAALLLHKGLRRGDVVATSLPFLKEHVYLMYACFQLGILVAPLDLRLKAREILQGFAQVRPKAYFFLGRTPRVDFRPIVREVLAATTGCHHWVQFQADRTGILEGAVHVSEFVAPVKLRYVLSRLTGAVRRASRAVGTRDPALVVFTTGSTGLPKAALLCHQNVLYQNIGLAEGFGVREDDRMLVNLPPSHVGGLTEQLMTSVYRGHPAVLLHVFDAAKSLQAIQDHRVTLCGQIPALFAMEWRLPDWSRYDLSSLRFAIYGGQAVDLGFLQKLSAMAGRMGTGLGLTETAGFCTFTPGHWQVEEIARSIGFDSPLCPMTVRAPMGEDGRAGAVLPPGEVGEICFTGPQVFLGYLHDEAATRRAISRDGVLYTGDLGSVDATGLHFQGRARFVVKPKGYRVFPAEVEDFLVQGFPGRVASVCCVGARHEVWSEALVAFIELQHEAQVSRAEVDARLRGIAAFKRPAHVVFLPAGTMPLNRVAKVDALALQQRAAQEVEALRAQGGWDRAPASGDEPSA